MITALRSKCFQNCRLLQFTCPISKLPVRTVNYLQTAVRKPKLLDKSQHRVVYSFPYIKLVAGIIGSRISVPVSSFVLAPFIYFFAESYILPVIGIAIGCSHCALATLFSKVAVNTVGKMYVNKENDISEVIISSVNKYGKRIDRIHDVKTLINVDYPDKLSRSLGFIAIGVENSDVMYKINTRHATFIDEMACDTIFGFLWEDNETEVNKTENKCLKQITELEKNT